MVWGSIREPKATIDGLDTRDSGYFWIPFLKTLPSRFCILFGANWLLEFCLLGGKMSDRLREDGSLIHAKVQSNGQLSRVLFCSSLCLWHNPTVTVADVMMTLANYPICPMHFYDKLLEVSGV